MKRIIFHLPHKVLKHRYSANNIRPNKLLDAFISLGYEVDLVEGYAKERTIAIKKIVNNINSGVKYDFLYSESSTMPTLLTEKNHLPFYPFLDFKFFLFCKSKGIKIGLFYRDIFWRFYKIDSCKKIIAHLFYNYDIFKYNKLVDVIFLPSLEMAKYIPNLKVYRKIALPSGLKIYRNKKEYDLKRLNVLYVGGIGDPYDVYNLELFLNVVNRIPEIEFTLCCRKEDWEQCKEYYASFCSDKVKVVHYTGDDVLSLYSKTDLFCLFLKPTKYWEFAMPFKLFESVGSFIPLLAVDSTCVGNYIQRNQIGFTCAYSEEELYKVLSNIVANRYILKTFKGKLEQLALSNTWEKRCIQISNDLN